MMQYDELAIAKQFGTPLFLFDGDELEARVFKMKEIVGDAWKLCYSMKANSFLVPWMDHLIGMLEVCSPGELDICKTLHVPGDHILYSGVNKTAQNVADAVDYGCHMYTCESIRHVHLLHEEAKRRQKVLPVLLRMSSGSQFGMIKTELYDVIRHRDAYPYLSIEGLHYFAGTQRKQLIRQKKELAMLKDLFIDVKERYGFILRRLEYGPGFAVPLFEGDDFSDDLRPLKELKEDLLSFSELAHVQIEMGRFIAASCGRYMTTVEDCKKGEMTDYAIVDGGIHHVNYIGNLMGMKTPKIRVLNPAGQEKKTWCLCGSLCSTNDVLAREFTQSGIKEGTVLCFENSGAYAVSEAMTLFLSRKAPAVVLCYNGSVRLVRDGFETSVFNTIQEKEIWKS